MSVSQWKEGDPKPKDVFGVKIDEFTPVTGTIPFGEDKIDNSKNGNDENGNKNNT